MGRFTRYATMFKLEPVGSMPPEVACVNCSRLYPLSDLMAGEINEEDCGACGMTARVFYRGVPHRRVPEDDSGNLCLVPA